MSSFLNSLLYALAVLTSLFLILLVLIQRGKGGGLAGAFGGVGGSSAFGTKAGDVFTRVTIYTALVWFLVNMFLVYRMNQGRTSAFGTDSRIKLDLKSEGKADPGPAGAKSDPLAIPPVSKDTPTPKTEATPSGPGTGTLTPPAPAPKGDELPDPLEKLQPEPAPTTPPATTPKAP